MAQLNHETTTGDVLSAYLQGQATEFLRSLRLHRESTTDAQGAEVSLEAAMSLRRAARRIGGTLHTFRPLLDQEWASGLRPELAWLSGTLAREHAYAARLERLLDALHRLSGTPTVPNPAVGTAVGNPRAAAHPTQATPTVGNGPTAAHPTQATPTVGNGPTGAHPTQAAPAVGNGPAAAHPTQAAPAVGRRSARRNGWAQPSPQGADERGGTPRGLTVGAAKAAALLERQLTLARTRAHSAALQAFGSSRFHAVADNVAVLASEVPLIRAAEDLKPLAAKAEENLAEAVAALPLGQAGHPYNAEALTHGLAAAEAPEAQDAPWLKARALLRLHRYAQEVLTGNIGSTGSTGPGTGSAGAPRGDLRLAEAGHALDRHREAADAAAAAASAARTPRIAPATAYALGVLHADQRHEVEAARFAFHQAWLRETEVVSTP
ncbi:CHAD domain-containing protein [Streptomyces durmitorensis]|uniref:CHAD domain-containing protein n=1 Tax=Streptomyces durmitorensis TaxID=319947 RepID=A0ABY4PW90_9ACTN|nr:CHAD domain-containing protein [Streptomyces durmitorensis]UQT57712.1 CHAD domain-containing protein [Streptomyces durmitorensis]